MASKQLPLALISMKKRWHLVRDFGKPIEVGRAVSLCGRVYQTFNAGWTQTTERQDDDHLCGHCISVRLNIRDGRSPLTIAMIDQEVPNG